MVDRESVGPESGAGSAPRRAAVRALSLVPGKGAAAGTNLQVGLQIGAQKFSATLTGSGSLHALQLTLAAQAPILGKPASLKAQGQLQAGHQFDRDDGECDGARRNNLGAGGFHAGSCGHWPAHHCRRRPSSGRRRVPPQLHVNAELSRMQHRGSSTRDLPWGTWTQDRPRPLCSCRAALHIPWDNCGLPGLICVRRGDAGSLPPLQLTASADLANDGAKITLHSPAGDATHMSVEGSIPVRVGRHGQRQRGPRALQSPAWKVPAGAAARSMSCAGGRNV